MSIDQYILSGLNSFAGISPFLDSLILFFAKYHIYLMTAAILAAACAALFRRFSEARRPLWEMAIFSISSALVARLGVTELIRFFYNRPRPFEIVELGHKLLEHSSGGSFPSGHAAFVFALAAAVWAYYPRLGILFLLSAFLVGLSRIAAGVHWPSDILGGALVGIGTAWLLSFIFKNLLPLRKDT